MSAPWHAAVRGVHGLDQRGAGDWPRCTRDGCTGRMLRSDTYSDGPELCFAHAGETQRAAALIEMQTRQYVDVRGTTLTGDHVRAILDHGIRALRYDFRGCSFTGDAPFPGTQIQIAPHVGDINSHGGVVDFGDATFESGADFTQVTFPGPVFFDGTTFTGPLVLDRARFRDAVWFLRTTVTTGQFTDTSFDRFAGFHRIRASQMIFFTGSTFSGRTHLEDVASTTLDFTDTTFSQRAVMTLEGACVFTGAQFDEGLELRLGWASSATLRRTHFGASSTVTTHGFADQKAALSNPVWSPTGWQYAQVLSLQDTDVEKLSLVTVDLQNCLFTGALNLDKLTLSGRITFARFPKDWPGPRRFRWHRRELIREELLWRAHCQLARRDLDAEQARKYRLAAGMPPERPPMLWTSEVPTGVHLASLYRSLRKALEDAKDEPGAGDFYYGEMEARRHWSGWRGRWSSDRWLLTLYWALSGYGQRASRALTALAVLLGTLTVLLTGYGLADTAPIQRITEPARPTATSPSQVITIDLTGQRATVTIPPPATPPVALDVTTVAPTLPPPDERWTAARVQRAISTLVTSLVPIATDQRLTALGGYLVLLGRVLGAILLGLAVLAIRARVKR